MTWLYTETVLWCTIPPMHFIYEHEVCACGSHDVYQHPQVQAADYRWTTLAEREADPTLLIAGTQQCVYIGDPTWYTCNACGIRIDPEQAQAWYTKAMAGRNWFDLPIKEEVGLGVFNPRGLERLRLSSK
jgi:hypothetical protein